MARLREKLKQDLALLDIFCISSGAMISSGLFILVGLAYAKTGPGVIISYLLASLLIIPTILSKSELISVMPKTGGLFFHVDRSMGPGVGTVAGLAAWFSIAFKTAFAMLGIGIIITLILPGTKMWMIRGIAVLCCIYFTSINLKGVKMAGRIQTRIVLILIGVLVMYILLGYQGVESSRYAPIAPFGFLSVLSTAGFVFISFAGTTKIASIAGEVKDARKTLPLGIISSWLVVSLLYLGVIYVTVGVSDPINLKSSLTPITLGGRNIAGLFGALIMSAAALLAFISTGNAGILTASRTPVAMAKADLLPKRFEQVSKKGVPDFSILFTSGFIIAVMVSLDLELFIKTASTLKLLLFAFDNMSLLVLRSRELPYYQPTFKAPLYPWMQIAGIIAYIILILQMGLTQIILSLIFIMLGILWYWFYAHEKMSWEYSQVYKVKAVLGVNNQDFLLDEELREILIDKNRKYDLRRLPPPRGIYDEIMKDLSESLNTDPKNIMSYSHFYSKKKSFALQ